MQLIVLPPRSSQQVHTAVGQSITTNVWSKDALEGFSVTQVPSNQGLIPSSRIDKMLILWIAIELGAVDTIGVAIVRGIALFELQHFLTFDLIVEADDGLTASSDEFGAIERIIETVELLIN